MSDTSTILEPDYYEEFHCIAADCQRDCCHGWLINVPRRCYMKIRSTRKSPELQQLVEEGIVRDRKAQNDTFYARMKLTNTGDCLFLNEKRLCRMQMELGHGILPDVCKQFPRQVRVRSSLVERSCSTACEEVVNLLWRRPLGLKFVRKPVEGSMRGNLIPPPEGKELLFSRVADIQDLTFAILQNRAYSLDNRVILLGMAMQSLAGLEDTQEQKEIDAWIAKYRGLSKGNSFREVVSKLPKNPQIFLSNNFNTMLNLSDETVPLQEPELRKLLSNLGVSYDNEKFTYNLNRYMEHEKLLSELSDDYLIENVAVNEWYYEGGPFESKSNVWDSYLHFCILYSLLKFLLAATMTDGVREEDIVQTIVLWSRMFMHNRERVRLMVEEFHTNQSDTLAHMAILVNG